MKTEINYDAASQELGAVAQILNDSGLPDTTYTFSQETGIVIGLSDTNGAIITFRPDPVADPSNTTNAAIPGFANSNS